MRIDDNQNTHWSFDVPVDSSGAPPAGGLVLQDVSHAFHHFAKDIRCVGLWIETELVDPSGAIIPHTVAHEFFALEPPVFTLSPVQQFSSSPVKHPSLPSAFDHLKYTDAALQFSEYFVGTAAVMMGLSAWASASRFFQKFENCEYEGMAINQIVLCSGTSHRPGHEPSGDLWAARFHPMIQYRLFTNANRNMKSRYTRLNSIRFDYRLHLTLDRAVIRGQWPIPKPGGNSAALFADRDSVGRTAVDFLYYGLRSGPAGSAITNAVFDAAEKPLVREVTAPALAKGFPVFRTRDQQENGVKIRCWDNIHWWGTREQQISAPGAFHAAHTHWRWGGASAATPAVIDRKFRPNTYPAGMRVPPDVADMWGPLVDPGIFMQSIRIAVMKNRPELNPTLGVPLRDLSKQDWKSLFEIQAGAPQKVSDGLADLVLWYSTEVHQAVTFPGSSLNRQSPAFAPAAAQTFRAEPFGTVFIHGTFFAHDSEMPGVTVGTTTKEYRPRSEKEIVALFRPAN